MKQFGWRVLMIWGVCLFLLRPALAETIALVVNEDAITMSDVNDRVKLITASAGLPDTPEIRSKLLPQIVGALVDEQIMLQEAHKLEQSVSQSEIEAGLAQIAQQNKMTAEQFKGLLQRSGIRTETLEHQIQSQVAWAKVVQQKLRPKVTVSESDIDNRLEQIVKAKGKTEYLIAEIFLPVTDAKNQDKARQLADRLVREIRAGKAPFSKVAQQFSQAAGSAQGGDLGWVQQGQLDPALDGILPKIPKGGISDPVKTVAGYHVLLIRDQRQISDATMPSRTQIMNGIGQERLERQARRYLMDLRSSSYIDNRLARQ